MATPTLVPLPASLAGSASRDPELARALQTEQVRGGEGAFGQEESGAEATLPLRDRRQAHQPLQVTLAQYEAKRRQGILLGRNEAVKKRILCSPDFLHSATFHHSTSTMAEVECAVHNNLSLLILHLLGVSDLPASRTSAQLPLHKADQIDEPPGAAVALSAPALQRVLQHITEVHDLEGAVRGREAANRAVAAAIVGQSCLA